MEKILPQPPSQELPMMVREGLKLEIPPVPSLEKNPPRSHAGKYTGELLLIGLPLGSQVTERLGLARLLTFRD